MASKKITEQSDLNAAFEIRKKVFVEEQGVPLEDEFDEFDQLNGQCEHILTFHNGQAVGTGRMRTVQGVGKLERICILEDFRKYGLGKEIIGTLETLAAEKGLSNVKLHGQTQAEGFYKKLGYHTASGEFMEDGIPHVIMEKELSSSSL